MNSKKSVISTLQMMDEIEKSRSELQGNDVGSMGFAFEYFLTCVLPKLKNSDIELMAWTNFEMNKEQIKQMILNDNTIWKDNIRIDR